MNALLLSQVLKQKLASKFPNQVFEYSCRVDGVDMSTGREKVSRVVLILLAGLGDPIANCEVFPE